MILHKKTYFVVVLLTIFLSGFAAISQTVHDSYNKLDEVMQNETLSKDIRIKYINVYYQKALQENNIWEQYKALEKKSFLAPYNEAVVLLNKIEPLVQKINNDSLSGRFLNLNASLHYNNRDFKEALNYALQAEAFNEKINNLYSLNSARIDIGNVYSHTRHYDKAIVYYTQAKEYYQTKKDYNHLRGYINTLYNLSRTYWQLGNINALTTTIKEIEQDIPFLKPQTQKLETAYVNYVKGGLAYLQNDYNTAHTYFEKALPVIIDNEDVRNEHVIYLYLGKIYRNQNNKEKAIIYFEKIDQLFQNKNFLNYELREAYDYLISYYKETNQQQLQLQATENLIALNNQFEKEQQQLTNTLHSELETKKLEASKTDLTHQLKNSKNTLTIGLIVAGLLCLILVGYIIWQYQQKKQWRLLYNTLISKTEQTIVSKSEEVITNTETAIDVNQPIINDNADKLSITELRILQGLELFETQKDFLNPIKLDDLATQLNTNRNTLSKLINVQKNANFNQYINRLRIKQVLVDLKNNKQLRKLSMQGLAETYGFANVKTFTTQFKTETQLTPAYFIEQLDFDDIQNAKIG